MKAETLGDAAGWMSENDKYFVPDGWGGAVIFATEAPLNSSVYRKQGLKDIASKGKTYVPYISVLFIKDCLHTAEEIIHQKQFDPKSSATRSKSLEFGMDFGESETKNYGVALFLTKGKGSNDNASPLVKQAYVIVNLKWGDKVGTSPYHAAAVVAVDGGDRITLEVFASTRASALRKEAGVYRMYKTTGSTGKTFHGYWGPQTEYFSDSSVTFAICEK